MSARDLLRQLLNVDPVQRMTASAAMRHPWLAKQLASATDMNKIRLETTILISDRPADDVDDQVEPTPPPHPLFSFILPHPLINRLWTLTYIHYRILPSYVTNISSSTRL